MSPEALARLTARIVAAARAMASDPNDMETRANFVRATFNHDWTAAVIVALAAEAEREAA